MNQTDESETGINRSIRVLHLEDDPRDAELIQQKLKAVGIACNVVWADGRDAFEFALERDRFDLVLTDYNLPGYDGMAALRRVRERQPEVPVIVISGTLGEEEAVECLKAGATDYVLKQRLQRLGSAVTRALKDAEKHRELHKARESLAEADRLESVGRLAAGIAHEVKNPLAIIRLGIDYLSKTFAQEDNQTGVLDDIRAAVNRADNVIMSLLDFSRQKQLARRPTNISQVIDNAIRLVKHEIELHKIEIVRNYDDSVPLIVADPDRLLQVFINLILNAAQAIGRDGSIDVLTRSIRLSKRDLEGNGMEVFKIGDPVMIAEIRDNGPGISAEHKKKLFEPFFTTKPIGEGTGLGLSVSRNIVMMHSGSIRIFNRPEGGASALVMLPVDERRSTDEKANTGSR